MKHLILLSTIFITFFVQAQRKIISSDSLIITGEIKKEIRLSIADFDTMKTVSIEDLKITNQQGELKRTLKQVKGILLKDVLSKLEFIYDKHKELNEMYFLFTAMDGYKVVFSWNEIFNTDAGNNMYFITEMDGKKLKDLEDKILFVATKDNSLGRRFIKGLKTISIKKAA